MLELLEINDFVISVFSRCVQTTIDPETGIKNGLEPVATLRR